MLCMLWNVFEVTHRVRVCCVSVCNPATLCCLQDLISQLLTCPLPGNACFLCISVYVYVGPEEVAMHENSVY